MATDGSALPAGRWTVRATDVVDELCREHALRLTRLAMVRRPGVCTDVVQDGFIGLYSAWPRLRNPENAPVYLRAAGRHRPD